MTVKPSSGNSKKEKTWRNFISLQRLLRPQAATVWNKKQNGGFEKNLKKNNFFRQSFTFLSNHLIKKDEKNNFYRFISNMYVKLFEFLKFFFSPPCAPIEREIFSWKKWIIFMKWSRCFDKNCSYYLFEHNWSIKIEEMPIKIIFIELNISENFGATYRFERTIQSNSAWARRGWVACASFDLNFGA